MKGLTILAGCGLNELFEEVTPNPTPVDAVPVILLDKDVLNRPLEEDVPNQPDEGCVLTVFTIFPVCS